MKKSQQRKLEKKRKAEREKRKEKAAPLAYHGRKYQTEALMPLLFATEGAIYEAFVLSQRTLTDHDVREALEQLVLQVRKGQIDLERAPQRLEGELRDIIKLNILMRWHDSLENSPHPGRDNLIGILRTVIGSVENHATISRSSREYLKFIEGFMRKAGVHVEAFSDEEFQARFPDAPQAGEPGLDHPESPSP